MTDFENIKDLIKLTKKPVKNDEYYKTNFICKTCNYNAYNDKKAHSNIKKDYKQHLGSKSHKDRAGYDKDYHLKSFDILQEINNFPPIYFQSFHNMYLAKFKEKIDKINKSQV